MKILYLNRYLAVLACMVMLLSGCMASLSKAELAEYRAGEAYAEKMAKQDAIKEICPWRFRKFTAPLLRNLGRHMRSMEDRRSELFLKGFDQGYRRDFTEYMDFYCGE
ncbi:hypothetical protein [Desulfospira joergensenii]|uniref:hypothetical protein n=1 Tax=Desulfospira joergensenii TaxID=53329 RepID=UPI0003B49B33|nr:hypothetical protein [Desulfospira joergensenii]